MITPTSPGPWEVRAGHVESRDGTIICKVGNIQHPGVAADARLIAAAPSLLEALEASAHAHEQTLATLEWAQANVPGTNLRADILLQRLALNLAARVIAQATSSTTSERCKHEHT